MLLLSPGQSIIQQLLNPLFQSLLRSLVKMHGEQGGDWLCKALTATMPSLFPHAGSVGA